MDVGTVADKLLDLRDEILVLRSSLIVQNSRIDKYYLPCWGGDLRLLYRPQ